MGPKNKKQSKDKSAEVMSDDHKSPTRKSNRKRKAPEKFGMDDDLTPEKKPVHSTTPRKSRRSKDLSPPPLRHRQNRMPEQVELVKNCKFPFFMVLIDRCNYLFCVVKLYIEVFYVVLGC